MKLGNLQETIILIDTDFLNERIRETISFYKGLYPEKTFTIIEIRSLLDTLVERAGIDKKNIDVLFSYSLSRPDLKYCTPGHLTYDISDKGIEVLTGDRRYFVRAFFGEDEEYGLQHFLDLFRTISFNKQVISKIILIADHPELHDELKFFQQEETELILFKLSHDSSISLPIYYGDIDYVIGLCLGLKNYEL